MEKIQNICKQACSYVFVQETYIKLQSTCSSGHETKYMFAGIFSI